MSISAKTGVVARSRALAVAVALTAAALARPAAAQTEAEKLERATALYEEGTRLLDAGRVDEACPKLARAVDLVPIGVGAQLALGACYERQGRLASALVHHEKAAALGRTTGQAERAARAEAAARALAARVGTLILRIDPAPPASPPDVVVRIDGVAIPADAIGAARPVDAGVHRIEATAGGHAPFVASVTTRDGAASELVIRLVAAPASAPVDPPPSTTASPVAGDAGASPLRPLGVVLGGVGAAGLVLGAVTGALALDRKGAGDEGCDARDFCPPAAIEARDEGFTMATISTIGFAAGGALLATGVVLFVVGGDDEAPARAEASLGPRGFTVRGAF